MDRDAGTTRDVHCVNKTEAESARVEFEEEMLLRSESQTWRANIVASTWTGSLDTCSRTCFRRMVAAAALDNLPEDLRHWVTRVMDTRVDVGLFEVAT